MKKQWLCPASHRSSSYGSNHLPCAAPRSWKGQFRKSSGRSSCLAFGRQNVWGCARARQGLSNQHERSGDWQVGSLQVACRRRRIRRRGWTSRRWRLASGLSGLSSASSDMRRGCVCRPWRSSTLASPALLCPLSSLPCHESWRCSGIWLLLQASVYHSGIL